MAMELISMDHWESFFDNPEEMKRAQEHQLERTITVFPWIATIDKFQHWVYENPTASTEERTEKWLEIMNEFTSSAIDVVGLDEFRKYAWQRQLHLFEVPFYYIEYGMHNWAPLAFGCNTRRTQQPPLKNYVQAFKFGWHKNLAPIV